MLFSSPVFAAFFAVYFLLHLAIPPRLRIYLIITGSTVFYAWWRVDYVWVPFAVTALATGGVHWMTLAGDERFAGVALGVEGVERLLQPLLARLAGVDRAAELAGGGRRGRG